MNVLDHEYEEMLAIKFADIWHRGSVATNNSRSNIEVHSEEKATSAVFLLRHENIHYVGRLLLFPDPDNLSEKSETFARITAYMILGSLHSICQHDGKTLSISYHPITSNEKARLLDQVGENSSSELTFPFPFVRFTNEEFVSPPDYWSATDDGVQWFDAGEKHLRQYIVQSWKKWNVPEKGIVLDPACSTGTFLASLQTTFPDLETIGADLSESMISISQKKIKRAIHANAKELPIELKCDVLILRFLNYEVVPSKEAHLIFEHLIKLLNPDGWIFVMGFTQIALDFPKIINEHPEITILQRAGKRDLVNELFQFYVLRKHA